MKKLNKKGFTLVELLAVIVILGILLAIAIPAITTLLENARKNSMVDEASVILSAATNDRLTTLTGTTKDTYDFKTDADDQALLEKFDNSPWGDAYSTATVTFSTDGVGTVLLVDAKNRCVTGTSGSIAYGTYASNTCTAEK